MRFTWLLASVFVAAATPKIIHSTDSSEEYEAATLDFNNGRYKTAAARFKYLSNFAIQQGLEQESIALLDYEASCWLRLGNEIKAVKTYIKGINNFPESPLCYYKICKLSKQYSEHPHILKRVLNTSIARVIKYCKKAVELDVSNIEYWQQLQMVLTFSMFMIYENVQIYQQFLDRFPDMPRDQRLSVLSNYGHALLHVGRNEDALDIYDFLVVERPNFDNVRMAAHTRSLIYPIDETSWNMITDNLDRLTNDIKIQHTCQPNQQWTLIKNWTIGKTILQDGTVITVDHINPLTTYKTYGSVSDVTFVGPAIRVYPMQYHERTIFQIHFSNVYVTGISGLLISNCKIFSTGMYAITLPHFATANAEVDVIEIDVPVVSILQYTSGNYYHFIAEQLPKLIYLYQRILRDARFKDVGILMHQNEKVFQVLDMPVFKGLRDRVVMYPHSNTKMQFVHLKKGAYIVDWIRPEIDVHKSLDKNLWGIYSPPQESLIKTREFMVQAYPEATIDVVYLSRKGMRSIPNEDVLIEKLRSVFKTVVVHYGGTVPDQISLFSKAKVVLGAHGAGISNFLFTRDHAGLVIFPIHPQVEFCFSHLAAALQRKHWVLTNITSTLYGQYKNLTAQDLDDVVWAVGQALQNYNSKTRDEL